MESFKEYEQLRKLPTCQHIFHPECLIKWFGSDKQIDGQRCPTCNVDVTMEQLEKIHEEQE